jgi:hypothetical protein
LLLFAGFEVAGLAGFGPEPLNRGHHVRLLIEKSFSQLLRPGRFLGHHGDNLWERRKGLHAQVPIHCVYGVVQRFALKVRISLEPSVRLCDFIGKCRADKNLRQQRIRIERYRRKHLVKFGLAVYLARCCRFLRKRSERDHHNDE